MKHYTSLQGLIDYEKSEGVQWLAVKCGDGNYGLPTNWTQFSSTLISDCRADGIKIFGWVYVYGGGVDLVGPSTVAGEITVAENALALNPDGLIIDWEAEYEGLGNATAVANATLYCEAIRSQYPNAFLATAPIWDPLVNLPDIYRAFNEYCNAVMPQAYCSAYSTTQTFLYHGSPDQMIPLLDAAWTEVQNEWVSEGYADAVKPIIPIAYGATPVTGAEINEFVSYLKNDPSPATTDGYGGVSFYDADAHDASIWSSIASVSIGTIDTWTGATSNNWNDPTNWSLGAIPDSNTNVLINSGNVLAESSINVAALILDGGELKLGSDGGTSTVQSLTIVGSAALEVEDNALIINYGSGTDPISVIMSYVASGYNNDTWTGAGIVSSVAAADPGLYAVGYADGNTDAGTPAGANQIYIKNTLAGDANLDGVVNFADLLVVAQNFNHTLDTHGNPIDWADGDFNYDGKVNFADLLLVAQNFNKNLAAGQLAQTPDSSGDPATIPAETSSPAPATDAPPSPVAASIEVSAPAPAALTNTTNLTTAASPSVAAAPPVVNELPTPVSSDIPPAPIPAPTVAPVVVARPTLVSRPKAIAQSLRAATANHVPSREAAPAAPFPRTERVSPATARPGITAQALPANNLSETQLTDEVVTDVWSVISPPSGGPLFSDSLLADE